MIIHPVFPWQLQMLLLCYSFPINHKNVPVSLVFFFFFILVSHMWKGLKSHIWKQRGNHFPDHTFHWGLEAVFKDMGAILRPLIGGVGGQVSV